MDAASITSESITAAASIEAAAERIRAAGLSPARSAPDPVNAPMIRHWLEALGDDDPSYLSAALAPPAMAQVWTMRGLRPRADPDDPLQAMSAVLDRAGFTSVVATNCEQTYHRYLRVGELVQVRSRLTDVGGPKRTALGEGWFVTTESTWYVGTEPVAEMMFRVLKFRPGQGSVAPSQTPAPVAVAQAEVMAAQAIRPVVSQDTAFFWAGTAVGELRIQRCGGCGALRHPPGPGCPACGQLCPEYVLAAGTGEVFSYVVHHHPPIPGRRLPVVIALVALPEGVRMVGELQGVPPDDVRIGMPVEVTFQRVDDDLTLPVWRPRDAAALPRLCLEVTPTFVISTALATRDFQDVHHDRDSAVARGSKDIFVNILTTTGLVQTYVSQWAGPSARVTGVDVRLGVPCYAYETLVLSGEVTAQDGDEVRVRVTGRVSLGDHVIATVTVRAPAAGDAR